MEANRYSCDNSSATSILDQMIRALEKAGPGRESIRRVVLYIFCDFSISGLDASRQGYTSYKAVLSDEKHLIETTYIDDFTRAGRDELEWWRLAALSKRCKKRLIGASDGFDLSNSNSDMMITMFGLVSRLFIKGLREKVRRGMRARPPRDRPGEVATGFHPQGSSGCQWQHRVPARWPRPAQAVHRSRDAEVPGVDVRIVFGEEVVPLSDRQALQRSEGR